MNIQLKNHKKEHTDLNIVLLSIIVTLNYATLCTLIIVFLNYGQSLNNISRKKLGVEGLYTKNALILLKIKLKMKYIQHE